MAKQTWDTEQVLRSSSQETVPDKVPLWIDEVPTMPLPAEKGATPAKDTLRVSFSAIAETCFIIVGLLVIFFFLPRDTGGDGWKRYQALLHIMIYHQMPTIKYSLIGPIFAYPLVWLGRKMNNSYEWVLIYNQVIFALTLLISFLLLRKRVDCGLLRKFYLMLIIASMFVAHLAFFYGEVFTALCVGFGLLITYTRKKAPAGWLLIVLGVANTPATMGGLVLVVLKRMLDSRRLRYALILFLPVVLILGESLLRRSGSSGYITDHGASTIMPYSGLPNFSYPLFFGLLSEIFSFGKGLLFYAPGLLLPVRQTLLRWHRQHDRVPLHQVYGLWMCFVIGLLLVYACWWCWWGGIFWGPRFLLFASLPASLALATRLHHTKEASLWLNVFTLLVFALSVWVCIDGAVYQWSNGIHVITVCSVPNQEMLCYYTPEYSSLWAPFVFHYPIKAGEGIFIGYVLFCGLYLGVPLCVQIVRQATPQVCALLKKYHTTHLTLKAWRI